MINGSGTLRSSTDQNMGSNVGGGGGAGFPNADAANAGDPELDELATEVFNKYQEAKEYRKNWDRNWDKQFKYFMGIQNGNKLAWRADATVNLIRPIIEAIVAHMTDSNPQVQISPCEEAFVESADIMQQVLFRTWQDNGMRFKLNNVVRDTMIYGTSYMKCYYDERNALCTVEDLDIRKIYPSAGATTPDDALYMIYADNVNKHVVESRFPEAKGKLIGGLWDEDLTIMKNITSTKPSGDIPGFYTIPGQYPGVAPKTGGRSVEVNKDLVTYIEYWHRDPDDWDTVWVTIAANGVILHHEKDPFIHGKFPFAKFIDTGLTNTWYGTGEVHHLIAPQDSINQRRSQMIELLKLVANPPFLVPASAGLPNTDLANVPGIMITYQGQQEPKWMKPGEIQPAFFQLNAMDKLEMEQISGISDQSQGRKATGVSAASGIALVQEISQTFIRPKIRNMEASLIDLGEMMVATIQQFYTEQMTIRVAGRRADKLGKFIKVNVPALDENNQPVLKNDLSFGKYDVNVSVGSEPDFNKAGKYEQMKELSQLLPGIITPKMLLETVPDMTQEEIDSALMNTAGPGALPGEGVPPRGAPAGGLPSPAPAPMPSPELAARSLVQAQETLPAPRGAAPKQKTAETHAEFEARLKKVEDSLK